MATKKRDDRGANEKAFGEVREVFAAVPDDKAVAVNLDLGEVIMAGLSLVDRARRDGREERIAKLAPHFIEAGLIDKLETTCLAVQHLVDSSATEGATTETYKVEAQLVEDATATKRRMVKTVEYNLESVESVKRELADIVLGSGYLDLAQDLARLAVLYEKHAKALANDKVNYRSTDLADARKQAEEIRNQYRASKTKDRQLEALRPKAFYELSRLYNELRAAAQFAYRNQPDVSDEFEPLRTAVGVVNRRPKTDPKGEEPTPTPAGEEQK